MRTVATERSSTAQIATNKVLLVEGHVMVAEAMAAYLDEMLNEELYDGPSKIAVFNVASIEEALSEVKERGPFTLVLVDVSTCLDPTFYLVEELVRANKNGKIGIITETITQGLLNVTMRLGLCGVIGKSMSTSRATNIIKFMLDGERFFPTHYEDEKIFETRQVSGRLTKTEVKILRLIADGFKNKDIADAILTSEATTKMKVSNLMRKLSVPNRTMAVLKARELLLL
jgi:DNA-binding NarL/FixJ family response regulator